MSDAEANAKVGILSQIAAAERELALRNNVYPKRVADGKMKPEDMALEIKRMQAVLATLRFVAANENEFREFMVAKRAGFAVEQMPAAPLTANRFSKESMVEELGLALQIYQQRSTSVPPYRVIRLQAVIDAFQALTR